MKQFVDVSGPLDVGLTLARFRLWGEDPVNALGDGVFRRAVTVDGERWGYELTWTGGPDATRLQVSVPATRSARVLEAAVAEIGWICGLGLDLEDFYRSAERDPVVSELTRRLHGLRPTLTPGPFEMLVGSVCAQQVNLTFACTVRGRLARRFGAPVPVGGVTVHTFPEAARVATATVAELRSMQFTTRKAEYIVGLAQRVVAGDIDLDALAHRPNDGVIEAITGLRGFGRWSAEWFLCRGLGRGDVCPAGDLGVRRAFEHFYNRRRPLTERAIRRRAARWGAHQNLAVHYLLTGHRLDRAGAGGGT
jgi:DNA-3-methyladenine glycosylase II